MVDAVARQMRYGAANLGGYYSTSELCMVTTRDARAAAADFLNCSTEEVTFGHNMTTLVYHLAHAIFARDTGAGVPPTIGPGDNIVLSRLDHDANVGPWLRLAEVAGCEVRWIPLTKDHGRGHGDDAWGCVEGTLDLSVLETVVDENTKLVACGAASNALGTINDVKRVCTAARAVGAMSFVDAVHYAPHDLIDVEEMGCDFLACSPYKFWGPHSGIL